MGCGKSSNAGQPKQATNAQTNKQEEKPKVDPSKEDKGLTGGHQNNFKFLEDGTLLKISNECECKFYNEVFTAPSTDKYYNENQILIKFIPKFHGLSKLNDKECVKIDNTTHGIANPSCMDIKIGRASMAPDYSKEKAAKAKAKEDTSTTGSNGFRITGLTIKDDSGKTVSKLLKDFNMQYPQAVENLKKYFTRNGTIAFDKDGCNYFLMQMKEMMQFFETTNTRFFVSASLFFVLSAPEKKYNLKLIDLAHVGPIEKMGKTRDENFIWGLKETIKTFEELLASA
jgi:Inositol polyphosphate kinase